jgi:hypothetical protein
MTQLKESLDQIFGFGAARPGLSEIIFALGLSFFLNLLIATVYRRTYKAATFRRTTFTRCSSLVR